MTGIAPVMVTFDGGASYDPDGTIVSYNWIFGDGESASGQKVDHLFQKRGGYQVQLTVVDNQSATGSIVQSIEILGIFSPLNVAWKSFTDESLFMSRTVTEITWAANPNNDAIATIAKYRIYRKKTSDEDAAYNVYVEVDASTFKYLDLKVDSANEYVYAVSAIDSVGHESPLSGTSNNVAAAGPNRRDKGKIQKPIVQRPIKR